MREEDKLRDMILIAICVYMIITFTNQAYPFMQNQATDIPFLEALLGLILGVGVVVLLVVLFLEWLATS